MNADEYAWNVLFRNQLRVEALLEVAHAQEVDWLEFKADPFCIRDPDAPCGDVIWHTLKAVVAMVNGRGGCIVFGVEDDEKHGNVPLRLKDGSPVGDNLDKYYRQIESAILSKTLASHSLTAFAMG